MSRKWAVAFLLGGWVPTRVASAPRREPAARLRAPRAGPYAAPQGGAAVPALRPAASHPRRRAPAATVQVMETTTPAQPGEPEDALDRAVAHLLAARTLLAAPAAQARALARSNSPTARREAARVLKAVELLRQRLARAVPAVRDLEGEMQRAQRWHDEYERVNGR